MSVLQSCARQLLIGAALLLTAAAPAAAQSWDAYTYLPASTMIGVKGLNDLFDHLRQQTNNGLDIKLHLGGSLPINATNITEAVSDDVVQLGVDGFYSGNVAIAGALRLPLLIQNYEEMAKAEKVIWPYVEAAYAKKDLVVLGQYLYPPQTIYSRQKIAALADMKGQKIRVTSVETSDFVKLYGGIPLTIGTPDVPSALDRGLVEGVITSNVGGGYIWKDLLKYNYRFPVAFANGIIIVNKDAFDKLTPERQTMLRDGFRRENVVMTDQMKDEEDNLTKKMQADGLIVAPLNPAEIPEATARMAPLWNDWAKARGPAAVEAVAKIRAALGR